jgi:hypothetical protein
MIWRNYRDRFDLELVPTSAADTHRRRAGGNVSVFAPSVQLSGPPAFHAPFPCSERRICDTLRSTMPQQPSKSTRIPARAVPLNKAQMLEVQLAENLIRADVQSRLVGASPVVITFSR